MEVARCPRCQDAPPLAVGYGALREDVCADCAGRFLAPDTVERVLVDENGISHETLRGLIPLFKSKETIACPACATRMSPLVVHGVRLDFCTGCGGCWLDRGELASLGGGRYAELIPPPLAVTLNDVIGTPMTPPSARCAVFLASLDQLDARALAAAFARCPGLTEQDAVALARNNNGVVVDGVSLETANLIAAALTQQGIRAAAADDSWTSIVPATAANAFSVSPHAVTFGREANAPAVLWSRIVAVAAGQVRRTSMRQTGLARDPQRDVEYAVVEADDPMLEVLIVDPIVRMRCALSTTLLDARGRDRLDVFRERIAAVAARLPRTAAVGRGVSACVDGAALPKYRSIRDLEREEAWLLWRHHGPGVDVA